MNRILSIILICLASFSCQAQEHLRFMDIPIDGNIDTFVEKLVLEKGFTKTEFYEHEKEHYTNRTIRKVKGTFEGINDCEIYIEQHKNLSNVSSLKIDLPIFLKEEELNNIIERYQEKYGNPQVDSTLFTIYRWDINNSYIKIVKLALPMTSIFYVDYTENEIVEQEEKKQIEELRKKETIKEICGIPFGSSYEKALSILEKKYGDSDYSTDANTIAYNNKVYAGISFNHIYFLFQSDGTKTYMNGCIFAIDEKTLPDAKERLEWLHDKLSNKYTMISDIDSHGNKYYLGGTSPTDFNNFGFSIEIIKHDSFVPYPYSIRLMYGRYNYVNEEF